MRYIKTEHPAYHPQQAMLNSIAEELGVIVFRPDYHGKSEDKNTVLFYTNHDAEYNKKINERYPSLRYHSYYRPFCHFENSDINGCPSYDFANFGSIDLRRSDRRDLVKAAVKKALEKRIAIGPTTELS